MGWTPKPELADAAQLASLADETPEGLGDPAAAAHVHNRGAHARLQAELGHETGGGH